MTVKLTWKGDLIAAGYNAKTTKGDKQEEYVTAILYMTPHITLGQNLCPMAEKAGCLKACLVSAGRGAFTNVQQARQRKAQWFVKDRAGFMATLANDIKRFVKWCDRKGVKPAVRLNGTTDIRYEKIGLEIDGQAFPHIFAAFPQVTFYDYTKIANRRAVNLIPNYSLTFSYSEASDLYRRQADIALQSGMNVAVVFRSKENIPSTFLQREVIDGDRDDMRFLDPQHGVVVALYAKGKARRDNTGFVIDAESTLAIAA